MKELFCEFCKEPIIKLRKHHGKEGIHCSKSICTDKWKYKYEKEICKNAEHRWYLKNKKIVMKKSKIYINNLKIINPDKIKEYNRTRTNNYYRKFPRRMLENIWVSRNRKEFERLLGTECSLCNKHPIKIFFHHKTYEQNKLPHRTPSKNIALKVYSKQLITVCRKCHRGLHPKKYYKSVIS